MKAFYEQLVSPGSLELLALFFFLSLLATLLIIPWIVLRLPANYFASKQRHPQMFDDSPHFVRLIVLVIKNLFGACLLILGIAMLVLPGQGLLTILMGTLLLDFPGKFHCERWLVSRKPVWRSINWLRRKRGKKALRL